MRSIIVRGALFLASVGFICFASAQETYIPYRVPVIGQFPYAIGISHNGIVLGHDAAGFFIWRKGKGRTQIQGHDEQGRGIVPATCAAVNNLGKVCGSYELPDDGAEHAFIWYPNFRFKDLGALEAGSGWYSFAEAISDTGEVVGEAQTAKGEHAFSWGEGFPWNGHMIDLEPSASEAAAHGVDASGDVVGDASGAGTFIISAVQWLQTGGHTPPEAFRPIQELVAINNFAHAVGYNYTSGAYLWNPQTGGMFLKSDHSYDTLQPTAMNDGDEVVGMSYDSGAFLWTPSQAMHLLQDLVSKSYGLEFNDAEGVDDSGEILATGGRYGSGGIYLLIPTQQNMRYKAPP